MKKITKKQALTLAKQLDLNLQVIDINDFHHGLNIELEHGRRGGKKTNVTNDNLHMTAKIATAHLEEFPNYYKKLEKMEKSLDKYWEKRVKPSIYN